MRADTMHKGYLIVFEMGANVLLLGCIANGKHPRGEDGYNPAPIQCGPRERGRTIQDRVDW